MRRAGAFGCALVVAALGVQSGARGDSIPDGPGPAGAWLVTLGAQTLPAGLQARVDWLSDPTSRSSLALHASYRTISVDVGAGPSLVLLGGFLTWSLQLYFEPGFFVPVQPGISLDAARALDSVGNRRLGLRYGVTTLLGINYRPEGKRYWVYARETAWGRRRLGPEYDTQSDAILEADVGVELAHALMFDVWPRARKRHLWLYGEYTFSTNTQSGITASRPSTGLIAENLLGRVAIDLDVNYGLRDGPLAGWGVILAFWITPSID